MKHFQRQQESILKDINFRSVVICSAIMSIICALLGILSSILLSTPVGSTIVLANIILFILSSIIGKVIN